MLNTFSWALASPDAPANGDLSDFVTSRGGVDQPHATWIKDWNGMQ